MFKLYLTGIETVKMRTMALAAILFKLYLTGIETTENTAQYWTEYGSNCTLQELKHPYGSTVERPHFCSNCTLQELKQRTDVERRRYSEFKLYLTGIETYQEMKKMDLA